MAASVIYEIDLRFSDVFRGYRSGALVENGLLVHFAAKFLFLERRVGNRL